MTPLQLAARTYGLHALLEMVTPCQQGAACVVVRALDAAAIGHVQQILERVAAKREAGVAPVGPQASAEAVRAVAVELAAVVAQMRQEVEIDTVAAVAVATGGGAQC